MFYIQFVREKNFKNINLVTHVIEIAKKETVINDEREDLFVYWEPVQFESSYKENYYDFCCGKKKERKLYIDTF